MTTPSTSNVLDTNAWLHQLAVGNRVIVRLGGGRNASTFGTVERLTKTQILVTVGGKDGTVGRFRRHDGHEVGADTYYAAWLQPWTEDAATAIRRRRKERKARDAVHGLDFSKATDSELDQLVTIATAINGRA